MVEINKFKKNITAIRKMFTKACEVTSNVVLLEIKSMLN